MLPANITTTINITIATEAVIVTAGVAMVEITRAVITKAMVDIIVTSTIRMVVEVGTKVTTGETITLAEMVATVGTIGTAVVTTLEMVTRAVVTNAAMVDQTEIITAGETTTAVGMITETETVVSGHVTEWSAVAIDWTPTEVLGMDWTTMAAAEAVAIVAIRETTTEWVTKMSIEESAVAEKWS